jgi:Fe-S cluster assembly protein SufB
MPKGLGEDVVRLISAKKNEPEWLTEWRLAAYRHWLTMTPPHWAKLAIAPIDFQDISFYAAPKKKFKSLDEVDPKLLETYDKLGVPLHERARLAGVAVDAVFDSVSVGTTFKKELAEKGVIFCSMSEAVHEHPELVRQLPRQRGADRRQLFRGAELGGVLRRQLRVRAEGRALPDGAEHLLPHQRARHRPVRTHPDRLRGRRDRQLPGRLYRADARREPAARGGGRTGRARRRQIKYSTVQNWYPGDENGVGGIYNFVTKRGECRGARSKISWTQVETGSAITWKYPSCVLQG